MKRCCSSVLASLFFLVSFCQANYVIVDHGKWNNNASWALGHSPQNGEEAIIPADSTLVIDNNVQVSSDITIKVYGTLNFQVGKLRLTANSVVLLYPGGTINSSQGTSADKIEIGGISKYTGNVGTLEGPLMATGATINFAFMPVTLPVKFISYKISYSDNNVLLNWSTAEEENAALYLIERSNDAISWKVIGKKEASPRPAILNNYNYTDKETLSLNRIVYYRIKQVDHDGHFAYSDIKSINIKPANTGIVISTLANNMLIKFSRPLKGDVLLRLVTLSGQVVRQQAYNQPGEYIIFNKDSNKGLYILSITNESQIIITKQLVLD